MAMRTAGSCGGKKIQESASAEERKIAMLSRDLEVVVAGAIAAQEKAAPVRKTTHLLIKFQRRRRFVPLESHQPADLYQTREIERSWLHI
mmetsp:Transcript_126139/g.223433  ORF Transcript_126139/g.223433 Transcript_126139/m.223433 type:complete len:90 (+) Transcript_126139:1169-1438(+)